MKYIDAHALKQQIHDTEEISILDVREHGQYGENHLFFAVSLPYSVLELEIERLVPRKNTRIVLYGNEQESEITQSAYSAAARMGYTNLSILKNGIQGWQSDGYATFAGVNLPSKTFGELAEHAYETPRLSALELHELLHDDRHKIVVLDGRPVPEYKKMNIPGSVCCPNGELALRASQLAPDPETTIVINCAGRTRSIVGAQTLINLGIPNTVYALENGTQGWYLADLKLEHNANRLYPEQIKEDDLPTLQARSAALANRHNIETVNAAQVKTWLAQDNRTTYLCDIRTPEEYAQDKLPTAIQHTPGGQLIQATDEYIGVRKSRLVLLDFDGIRAPVTASWLKQQGWEVYLLSNPAALVLPPRPNRRQPKLEHTTALAAGEIAGFVAHHPQANIIDTRASMQYRKLRLQGSYWAIRPTLDSVTPQDKTITILLIGESLEKLQLLAEDLERAGHTDIYFACMDASSIVRCGLPISEEDHALPDDACIDFLFFVHDRHQGNKDAARKYLEWETNLISQIDEQERKTFSFDAHITGATDEETK